MTSTQPALFSAPEGWAICVCGCGRWFRPRSTEHVHYEAKCRLRAWAARQNGSLAALTPPSPFVPSSPESREAAATHDAGTAERHRREILRLLATGPLTYDDLNRISGIPENCLRPRMRDLKLAGKVVASQIKHKTRRNCNARCWELA